MIFERFREFLSPRNLTVLLFLAGFLLVLSACSDPDDNQPNTLANQHAGDAGTGDTDGDAGTGDTQGDVGTGDTEEDVDDGDVGTGDTEEDVDDGDVDDGDAGTGDGEPVAEVDCPGGSSDTAILLNSEGEEDGDGRISYDGSTTDGKFSTYFQCYGVVDNLGWNTEITLFAYEPSGDADVVVEVVGHDGFAPAVRLGTNCESSSPHTPQCDVADGDTFASAFVAKPWSTIFIGIDGFDGTDGDYTVYVYEQGLLASGETCSTDPRDGRCESELTCTADSDGDIGLCLETVSMGDACDPDVLENVCSSGTCHDADGDGEGTCREQCSYFDSCSTGQGCSFIEPGEPGVCVPTVNMGNDCDATGMQNVCAQGSQCDAITETCVEGCNLIEGYFYNSSSFKCDSEQDACAEPNYDGAGICRPGVELWQSCDPDGLLNGCMSTYDPYYGETRLTGCYAASGATGVCMEFCGDNNPYGRNFRECRTENTYCLDNDASRPGFCIPELAPGESCDPNEEANVCNPRSICDQDGQGDYVCQAFGSCDIPYDLIEMGESTSSEYFIALGNTRGSENQFESLYCSNFGGRDEVYALEIPYDADVELRVRGIDRDGEIGSGSGLRVAMHLRDVCDDVMSELACMNSSTPSWDVENHEIENAMGGEVYYVIVDEHLTDGTLADGGYYVLEANVIRLVDENEACDVDGVESRCRSDFFCHPETETCSPHVCGDGYVSGDEECDTGNLSSGDGCDANCEREVFTEVEPNNNQGSANDIGANTRIAGVLGDGDSSDWFKFDVSEEGWVYEVYLHLQDSAGNCPSAPSLRDSGTGFSLDEYEPCKYRTVEPFEPTDWFYIQVHEWNLPNTPYIIDVDVVKTAFEIYGEGEGCDPHDELFSRCDDGLVCAPDGAGLHSCEISTCGDGVVDPLMGEECDPGDVMTASYCDACIMEVFDESEPNNATFSANTLGAFDPIAGSDARIRGYTQTAGDVDYFAFTLNEESHFKAYVHDNEGTCMGADYNYPGRLRVWDEDGEIVVTSEESGGYLPWRCTHINWFEWNRPQGWSLPAGDYFVSFQHGDDSYASTDTPYFIDIDFQPVVTLEDGDACNTECLIEETVEICDANYNCEWQTYCLEESYCGGDTLCHPEAAICQTVVCGDGYVYGGKECDDGNTLDGDGCSSTCEFETLAANVPSDSISTATVIPDGFKRLAGTVAPDHHHIYEFEVPTASEVEIRVFSDGNGNCPSRANESLSLFRTDELPFFVRAARFAPSGICSAIIYNRGSRENDSTREALVLSPGTYYLEIKNTNSSEFGYEVEFDLTAY